MARAPTADSRRRRSSRSAGARDRSAATDAPSSGPDWSYTSSSSSSSTIVHDAPWVERQGRFHAHDAGFDLHAGVTIAADDRAGLEQLCHYVFLPPLGQQRLRRLADGRISVALQRPWADGTTHLVCTPLELLERAYLMRRTSACRAYRPRAADSGRRAHHRCNVLGCPWRIDFSRAAASLIAFSGRRLR
jgi:putative transposase